MIEGKTLEELKKEENSPCDRCYKSESYKILTAFFINHYCPSCKRRKPARKAIWVEDAQKILDAEVMSYLEIIQKAREVLRNRRWLPDDPDNVIFPHGWYRWIIHVDKLLHELNDIIAKEVIEYEDRS